MVYKQFQDLRLSALGFGAMRLPLRQDGSGSIDQTELNRMVDAAMANGVNYFDTAHPYHDGKSEGALGRSLARYPRETWYLADKFPGHQNVHGVKELQPAEVFEEQLQRCGVDYFDFYLLHNVNEQSVAYYCNPEKHCLDYFLEQKARGRIRHLGFSCHAGPEALQKFVDQYGKDLEFCQIQLNYVDWKLQNAEKKVEILRKAGLPVWVMEPVRGGKLASFAEETEAEMHALRPDESCAGKTPEQCGTGCSGKDRQRHAGEDSLYGLPLLLCRMPGGPEHPDDPEHGQRDAVIQFLEPHDALFRSGRRKTRG